MSDETKIPVVAAQDPKSAAAKALEAAFARDEEVEVVKASAAAGDLWCYSCDRAKAHMGIFFVKDPRGSHVFGPGDWYSAYHDNREVFDFELNDIICQQCFAERGERVHLRVSYAEGPDRKSGLHFRIQQSWMDRFAHKIERKSMEEWLARKKVRMTPPAAPAKELSGARSK